jgi:glucose-1-phosphate thymidylyltransferase
MKGVILAGGRGTRLFPLTAVVNKHLLPVYDKPMIFYPIQTLCCAGCTDILIVTGGENPGEFMRLLKDGKDLFKLNSIMYVYQSNPTGGIADALKLAEPFIGREKFMMILGDNLVFQDFSNDVNLFLNGPPNLAKIFLKPVDNPSAFGVAILDEKTQKVINIIEKPEIPPSNLAVVGVYLYDHNVFGIIKNMKPSSRGELEITDVNMAYVKSRTMTYGCITSKWLDTGSFDSLFEANAYLHHLNKEQ